MEEAEVHVINVMNHSQKKMNQREKNEEDGMRKMRVSNIYQINGSTVNAADEQAE